jgi:hypothetical protein
MGVIENEEEREGPDEEEVDGHDISGMGGQKSVPRGPAGAPAGAVPRDREFGDAVPARSRVES